MPDLIDLGFEEAGPLPGQARGWYTKAQVSRALPAGYARGSSYALDYSDGFDAGVTVNGALGPDGTMTADVVEDDNNAMAVEHYVNSTPDAALTGGKTYVYGCYLKAGTHSSLGLRVDLGGGSKIAVAPNLTTGVIEFLSLPSGAANLIAADIVAVTGGWYLLVLSFFLAVDVVVTPQLVFFSPATDGTTAYVGTTTNASAWGAFLKEAPLKDTEDFENGWGVVYAAHLANPTAAIYQTAFVTPNAFESFESGWANYPFFTVLALTELALYDAGLDSKEDFENGWNNTSYIYVLSGPTAALYDAGAHSFEAFEQGWGNDNYKVTLAGGDLDGATSFENFETNHADTTNAVRERVYTADSATDTFTSVAHHYLNDDKLMLKNVGGLLPTGLNVTVSYFVVNKTADTFQLSLTSGGAAVNFTDNGSGINSTVGDPTKYWTEFNDTL